MKLLFTFSCGSGYCCSFFICRWDRLAVPLFNFREKKAGRGHKGGYIVLTFCWIKFRLEHNSKWELKCSYFWATSKSFQGQNFPLCVPDLIPTPTLSLNFPLSPILLQYHMLHYLLNSPAISLLSSVAHPSITRCLSLSFLLFLICSSPVFVHSSLPGILPSGFICCGIVDYSPGMGSYCRDRAKRLSTFQEIITLSVKVINTSGSWEHGNHCVHPAFEAQRTGLPPTPVHHWERVCWPGTSTFKCEEVDKV